MAPINNCIKTQMRQLIYYHLDSHMLKNALFFAERLVAYDSRSQESFYLLALCYLRLGDNRSAMNNAKISSSAPHLGCAYVHAQAALALERYQEGIKVLEKLQPVWSKQKSNLVQHSQTTRPAYPDAAAFYCLLGKLHFGYDDQRKAISCFEEALKLNPFIWDAFTALCDMGVNVRVPNIFKVNSEFQEGLKTNPDLSRAPSVSVALRARKAVIDTDKSRPTSAAPVVVASETVDPFNNVPRKGLAGGLFATLGGLSQKINESSPNLSNIPATVGGGIGPEGLETPTGPSSSLDVNIIPGGRQPGVTSAYPLVEPPQAPARARNRTVQGLDFGVDAPKITRGSTSRRQPRNPEQSSESAESGSQSRSTAPPAAPERKRTVSGQVIQGRQASVTEDSNLPQTRRSVRLFNQIRPSAKTSTLSNGGPSQPRELKKAKPPITRMMRPASGTSTVGRVISGNRKPTVEDTMDADHKEPSRATHNANTEAAYKTDLQEAADRESAYRYILSLFETLGNGYYALSQFRCHDALQYFTSLTQSHRDTAWVLSQTGRAYYEQALYKEAEHYYKKAHKAQPTRFEGMEIYSTILWHLKSETDLAFLAHELIDTDWQSPHAWVALGNAFSLGREHESALKCFKRATQLDPTFAYAFTLQGHEHVANEEYDKAMRAYRRGMAADKRHYNAYYGIARVYDKLGELDKAILHFEAASRINPTNAVLITWTGTIFEKRKQHKEALRRYSEAIKLAPGSALTKYKKARCLMAIHEYSAALRELMELKTMAPDEASVHYLLGKLYKCLGEKGLAVKHFTIALNLDPKVSILYDMCDLKGTN